MSDNTNLNNQNVHPRVAILLSTRDGEKYLAKQLQSLLDQEQVQVQVFGLMMAQKIKPSLFFSPFNKTYLFILST